MGVAIGSGGVVGGDGGGAERRGAERQLREAPGWVPLPRGEPASARVRGGAARAGVESHLAGDRGHDAADPGAHLVGIGRGRLEARDARGILGIRRGAGELGAPRADRAVRVQGEGVGGRGVRLRRREVRHRAAPAHVWLGRDQRRAGPELPRVRRHLGDDGPDRDGRRQGTVRRSGLHALPARERFFSRPREYAQSRRLLLLLAQQPNRRRRDEGPARGPRRPCPRRRVDSRL
mmetsp:Transcript_20866/g.65678  ORF Transcript_20866/g.65678 Transcript_20866/m.65678 type:complete len:234 (-) Transcript_20866:661-1362(-)